MAPELRRLGAILPGLPGCCLLEQPLALRVPDRVAVNHVVDLGGDDAWCSKGYPSRIEGNVRICCGPEQGGKKMQFEVGQRYRSNNDPDRFAYVIQVNDEERKVYVQKRDSAGNSERGEGWVSYAQFSAHWTLVS
ncbi:MAG TPA: hypothetical protein VGC09_00385 [Rhodopila sp.]